MEELREPIYQFFHSWVFLSFLFTAVATSIITFRTLMIKRSEKNQKKLEEKSITLFLSAGTVFMGWSFYSMSFNELGFEMLNVALLVTFSLLAIFAIVISYDKWKIGQQTLDKFLQ